MYNDEYGNEWASYEDYKNYLNKTNNNFDIDLMNELVKEAFKEAFIDDSGAIWENKDKYIENTESNS